MKSLKLSQKLLISALILVAVVCAAYFKYTPKNTEGARDVMIGQAPAKQADENTEVTKPYIFPIDSPTAVVSTPETESSPNPVNEPVKEVSILDKITDKIGEQASAVKDSIIKPAVLYKVAFAAQAPFGNWDPPYDEACEEASMIMAAKYFKGQPLDKVIMDSEILAIVDWQTKNGYAIDIPASSVVENLHNYYDLRSRLINNPTASDLEKELTAGNLVIVPAAGRQLGNPNFRNPGPIYHMLVIIGYDSVQKEFITNDPGTRNGEKYRYSYTTLLNAIHDWNNGDVENGAKVVVVVEGE